ncbi:MAG: hypothetical protein JSU62_00195 [Gammaproteobacteria bacterium]|nr:MAG: hypothetical protein JSU62_00195 [Gammaproteobacteria bacterium]
MNTIWKLILVALSAALVALSGCGGGGGSGTVAGIGGTGKIASGTITGFGSIFVNGVEYNTDSASIAVDDSSATESDLRVGMVVTVTGTVSDSTGNASSVVYDNEVEGPVTGITALATGVTSRSFTVLGTDVVVDATGTIFDNGTPGFSFDTIDNNDVVEVSGFFDALGVLQATYIEKTGEFPGTTDVQLKGTVTGATGAGGTATFGESFTVNGITVNILDVNSTDLSDVPGGLVTDGMFVEVKGLWVNANTVDASRIEEEDTTLGDDGDDVSVEGLVSGFTNLGAIFFVNGQPVDAATATLEPGTLQLANDLRVEAEGTINSSGVLIAEKIESRGGDVEVQAQVNGIEVTNTSLNEGNITLLLVVQGPQTLTVQTNSRTQFDDKTDTVDPMRLADIAVGDYLEIRGFVDDGGAVVASEVRRDGLDGDDLSGEDVILQGPVSSAIEPSITILGVTFSTDASTEFENLLEQPISSSEFYGFLGIGTLVKLKDDSVPGDGIADEASLED